MASERRFISYVTTWLAGVFACIALVAFLEGNTLGLVIAVAFFVSEMAMTIWLVPEGGRAVSEMMNHPGWHGREDAEPFDNEGHSARRLRFEPCDERILTDEYGEEWSVIGHVHADRLDRGHKRDRIVGLVVWPRSTHAADHRAYVQTLFMQEMND